MLSAQCTDERVNKETAHLFEKYQSVEDYANADEDELSEDLNSITYHNSKAGYIKSSAQTLIEEHDGEVPDTMEALTDLKGSVGRRRTSSSSTPTISRRASSWTRTSSASPGASASPGGAPGGHRTGPDAGRAPRALEELHALAHRARPQHLHGAEP